MSRNLAVTQRQARTLLRAAEAERAVVEVQVGTVIYRLIPACLAPALLKPLDAEEEIRL